VRSHSQLPRDPRSAKVAWETGRRCFQPGQRASQADRALRKQREGTASQETARSQPQGNAEPKAPHRASPGGCVSVRLCLLGGWLLLACSGQRGPDQHSAVGRQSDTVGGVTTLQTTTRMHPAGLTITRTGRINSDVGRPNESSLGMKHQGVLVERL